MTSKPYLYAGGVVLTVVSWALISSAGAILAGHPSYWIAYGAMSVAGCVAIACAVVWRRRPTRWWIATASTIGLLLIGVAGWWLTPFGATEPALEAMESGTLVAVETSSSTITLTPTGEREEVGMVFLPGAKVDARAYAHILRPIAEAGVQVVIVKPPLGIAFFSTSAAPAWASAHPEVGRWVVAGHSLGGVVAALNAAESEVIDDLILWASYPADDVSDRSFTAVSISGTNDGLTTPEDVDDSLPHLPDATEYVRIEGAVHSHFGDYGTQPGDGQPGISRDEAQTQIIDATLGFLVGSN